MQIGCICTSNGVSSRALDTDSLSETSIVVDVTTPTNVPIAVSLSVPSSSCWNTSYGCSEVPQSKVQPADSGQFALTACTLPSIPACSPSQVVCCRRHHTQESSFQLLGSSVTKVSYNFFHTRVDKHQVAYPLQACMLS